jgi:hypothetical protein
MSRETEDDEQLLAALRTVAAAHGVTIEQCPCPLHRGYVRLARADGREIDTRKLPWTKD